MPLTSMGNFAVLVLLTTVKEFTATAVPILKPEQLMTPDKRIVLVTDS
jgi:hypothetical protein